MLLPIASTAFLGAGCIAYYFPYISRLEATRALRRRVRKERTLVLTYDDGPSRTTTPEILSVLRRYDAKATFFMLGRSARQYPDVASLIVEEGHEVGCHTDQHFNAWKVNPWRAVADINAGYKGLSAWVDAEGLYRPPYGKMTLPTSLAVRCRGARIGWWTIDSGDSHSSLPSPEQIADRLIREGGGVVLLHDLDRAPDRNAFVLETTVRLLEIAARDSFRIRRLGELGP